MFGTRYAAAPEIWRKEPYTRAVDSWGLGVTLYMMVMGKVRCTAGALHGHDYVRTCIHLLLRCRAQMPFPDEAGLVVQMEAVSTATFDRESATWHSLSDPLKHLIIGLLRPNAEQVRAVHVCLVRVCVCVVDVLRCLRLQRLTVEDALMHPWVQMPVVK
jgi:serine/threonine protein kinase